MRHRTAGGIVAGGLFVRPSLLILIVLSWIYAAFGNLPAVAGILYGIKPAVTAIVLFAVYRIGSRALKNSLLWFIAVAAFVANFLFGIPFPMIILGAGMIGAVGGLLFPKLFTSGSHQGAKRAFGPAIIDDHTPTPEHARFSWPRLWRVLSTGVGLWALAMAALIVQSGLHSLLAKMGWFFTKAALLTFGGAFAVLPYVFQGAVEDHAWPTAALIGIAITPISTSRLVPPCSIRSTCRRSAGIRCSPTRNRLTRIYPTQ